MSEYDPNELKPNVVRKSLLTPILFMGGERELSLMVIMVSVVMIIFVQTWTAFFSGIVLWFVAMPLLRAMAKKDTQMSQVYKRSLNYQTYYPASSTIHVQKQIKQTSIKFKR